MIDPIAVDALLLRTQLPELTLRPGASLVARVAARAEQHGVLVLAGVPLTAQLPDEVAAGDTLRLRVTEVTAERVTMRMEPPAVVDPGVVGAAPAPPPPHVAVGEPPRRNRGSDEGSAGVTLSFVSAALGRLDLRVDVGTSGVSVEVETPPGQALELASTAAPELKDALEQQVGGRASVSIKPRREPLDLYA